MSLKKFPRVYIPMGLYLVAVLVFFGCEDSGEQGARLLARGNSLLEAGEPVQALEEYRKASEVDPQNPSAQLGMGRAYLAQEAYCQAHSAFRAALTLDPELDQAKLEEAALLVADGRSREALDELDQIRDSTTLQPRLSIIRAKAAVDLGRFGDCVEIPKTVGDTDLNAEIQALLSICYREVGDGDAAVRSARMWRKLDPKAAAPYLLLAQLAAARGDKAQATEELRAMTEARPQEVLLALMAARALEELGIEPEAEAAYARLPDTAPMVKARADFAWRHGRREEAARILQTFLRDHPADVDVAIPLIRLLATAEEWSGALARLEETLRLELPKSERERLIFLKASLKEERNELDEAGMLCTELLEQNPDHLDAHQLLGSIRLKSGHSEEAERHLQRAATVRSGDAGVAILLARSQYANGKGASAMETLRSSIGANPGNTQLRMELMQLLLALKDPDSALKTLDEGLEINPKQTALLLVRGKLRAALDDDVNAESDFRQVIGLAPEASEGYLELGRLMLKQAKHDQAIVWFKQALPRGAGWETAFAGLLKAYLSRKDSRSALALAESEAAKRPNSALVHWYLGLVRYETKNTEKATASFLKAIALAPEWSEPYRALSELYLKQGKLDKAIAKMEALYAEHRSLAALMNLVLLQEKKGQKEKADRLFDELAQRSGRSESVLSDIAWLLAERRNGEKDLARAAAFAAEALAKQPDNAVFMDTAAWVDYRLGSYDRAWALIEKALAKQPDSARFQFHAAMVARARGEKILALQHLEKAMNRNLDSTSLEKARSLKRQWEG